MDASSDEARSNAASAAANMRQDYPDSRGRSGPHSRVLARPDVPAAAALDIGIGEGEPHLEWLALVVAAGDAVHARDDADVAFQPHLEGRQLQVVIARGV